MNPSQLEYLRKNYKTRSVNEIARELKLDRKVVLQHMRRIVQEKPPSQPVRSQNAALPRGPLFHAAAALVLVALTFVLYHRTLGYPFMNWDDPEYVTENRLIRTLGAPNLVEIFTKPHYSLYIPFTLVSYAVDYQLYHLTAWGYHFTNVLIHSLNAALVYLLVAGLTGNWLVSLGTALIFAVHPVQVESAAWIAERKNVLSSMFLLLSLLAYARRKKRWLIVSGVLFLSACFSKPNVVVAPLVFILLDACQFGERIRRHWKKYALFFLLAFFFAVATYVITRSEGKMLYHGGSAYATFATMLVVMVRYLELLIAPVRQSLLYEFPVYGSIGYPPVAIALFIMAGLIAAVLYLSRKDKKLFFWGAWYFVFLIPVMNIIPFPSLMNDRYLYLPLIGFFTLFFLVLHRKAGAVVTVAVIVAATAAYSVMNLRRQVIWSHPETLWLETQKKTEDRTQSPFLNLGMQYLREGKTDEAIAQFNKVLEIRDYAPAYDGLGIAYYQKGDHAKAIEFFKKALSKTPNQAGVHSNLAIVYQRDGQQALALEELTKAVELEPQNPKYHNNLGSFFMDGGQDAEAEAKFLDAIRLDPAFSEALYNLGVLYSKQGNAAKAREYWSRLVAGDPGFQKIEEVKERLSQLS